MRMVLVLLMLALQILLVVLLIRFLRSNALYVYIALEIAAILQVARMVSRQHNASYTMAWLVIIVLLPVFGFVLYAMWGRSDIRGLRAKRIRQALARGRDARPAHDAALAALRASNPDRRRMAELLRNSGYPLYQHTDCRYFAEGEWQFRAMLADIAAATRCVFISTFILNAGVLWAELRSLLIERAAAGVDVRIMVDDFGSLFTTPDDFVQDMTAHGIRVCRFNPVHKFSPRLSFNYRNHQKIVVVDANIAYTGGANIADEYANIIDRFGHWKDTGIRLEGEAVGSVTLTFLEMWEAETGEQQDYAAFTPTIRGSAAGYYQPFADGPATNPDNPAETMYRQMITTAREYVYITTPYFVVAGNMMDALCAAAKSGVDVRLIMPKKNDHWYVGVVSRSNYGPLLEAGARIYEYTPGFIHAKTIMADDDHAITGSINMDYRSFNMHFENAVWICDAPVLSDIKNDLLDTIRVSTEISLEAHQNRPLPTKLLEGFLRVFSVLM